MENVCPARNPRSTELVSGLSKDVFQKKSRPKAPRLCRCSNQSVFPGYLTKYSIARFLQKYFQLKGPGRFDTCPGFCLREQTTNVIQTSQPDAVYESLRQILPGQCRARPS